MSSEVVIPKNDSRTSTMFLLVMSIVFSFYYIDLGFAFKPFMILSIVVFVLSLKFFEIHKLRIYEVSLLMFFTYFMLTGFLSEYPMYSIRMIFGIALVLFCYFIMRFIMSRSSIEGIENSISVAGLVFNTLSLLMYVMGLAAFNFVLSGNGVTEYGVLMDRNFPRLIGITSDPNIFTFYNFTFFFFYITHLERKWAKTGAILSGLTLLLTLSRGGILSALVGLFILFLTSNLKRKIQMVIITPVIAIILNFIIKVSTNVDMFGSILERFTASDGGSGRSIIWSRGFQLFEQNPIFGIGVYNFRAYSEDLYGTGMYMHNSYMEALVEGGLIGILLYLLIFITVIITYYNNRNLIKDKGYILFTFMAMAVMMSTYTFMVNEFFFFVLALLWRYLYEIKHPNKFIVKEKKRKERKRYRIVWSK